MKYKLWSFCWVFFMVFTGFFSVLAKIVFAVAESRLCFEVGLLGFRLSTTFNQQFCLFVSF